MSKKQTHSGNTLKRQSFRPARPKPTRTKRVCLSLRGHGRKRRYKSERPLIDRPAEASWFARLARRFS
jgi:hypothetical protein